MDDSRNFDIFISYAARDRAWASVFASELESRGLHAWFDQAEIGWGDRWEDKLEKALRQSPVIAILLSPDYLTSPSALFELGAAVGGNKRIFPIVTQDVESSALPSLFRDRKLLQEKSPEAAGKLVAEAISGPGQYGAVE